MVHNLVLQFTDKGETGIGAFVRVDQFDGNRAKLFGVLAFGARQSATGVPTDFRQHISHRILAVALFVFRAQRLDRALHFAHHFDTVVARRPRCHGKVARDRRILGRVEEAPVHIATDQLRRLRCQQNNRRRQHDIPRCHDTSHHAAENRIAEPAKAFVHNARRQVVPVFLAGVLQGVGHVVGQDQKTFHQRRQQHNDHGKGNILDQITEPPANRDQSEECDHGRQRGAEYRQGHTPRCGFRGLDR